MSEAMQPMLMSENSDSYATYTTRQKIGKNKAFVAVGAISVVAMVIAIVAVSIAVTNHTTGTELKTELSGVSSVASRNTMSEISGLMLMNQPVCVQSHAGLTACLDILQAARLLLSDLDDPNTTKGQIITKVEKGEYNVGNSIVFSSNSDETIKAAHPALAAVFADKTIRLTAADVADISKCEFIWEGVACLAVVEIGRSESCANVDQTEACMVKVVPVIHILDPKDVINENGRARRTTSETVIFSIAGGIPDLRPLDDRRRAGCFSGLGEPLVCSCTSRGCGYLDYRRDPSCRWGC